MAAERANFSSWYSSGVATRLDNGLSIDIGRAELPYRGEDASLLVAARGICGVFDGVGGAPNGALAARCAQQAIEYELSYCNRASPHTQQEAVQTMMSAFLFARSVVMQQAKEGLTTATAGRFLSIEEGNFLIVGHSGDSRVYSHLPGQLEVSQITRDHSFEGHGGVIDNYLGHWLEHTPDVNMPDDFFAHKLSRGERIMFCTDGITGDGTNRAGEPLYDSLDTTEIAQAIRTGSPEESAGRLIEISKKIDDKTVIVAEVTM